MSQQFKVLCNSNSQEISFSSSSWLSQQSCADQELEKLYLRWGRKIQQLESQIQDVQVIKQDVNRTLVKARRGLPQIHKDDKENINSLNIESNENKIYSNTKVEPPNQQQYEEEKKNGQSFTYQYNQKQQGENSIDLNNDSNALELQLRSDGWWSKVNYVISRKPIGEFLIDATVDQYISNFLDIGVYQNEGLIQYLKEEGCWDSLLLKRFGIDKIGHRKTIYIQLMEDCNQYERIGLLKYSQSLGQNELPTIQEWLISLNLLLWYPNFIEAGYDNFERMIVMQNSESGFLNSQQLMRELNFTDLAVENNLKDGLFQFQQLFEKSKQAATINAYNVWNKLNEKLMQCILIQYKLRSQLLM